MGPTLLVLAAWTVLSAAPAARTAPVAAGLSISTPPATASELIAHFKRIDSELDSLSARFSQTLIFTEAGMRQSVEGTVDYLKPDRLRVEQFKPERQTVVSDGRQIWVYRRAKNQVVQASLEDWRKTDPLLDNLLDFGNYARWGSSYEIALDTRTLKAVLTPLTGSKKFSLTLTLKGPEIFPAETELDAGATRIRTSFSQLRFNPKLKDESFRFDPPKNAEVFRDFKPPFRREEK